MRCGATSICVGICVLWLPVHRRSDIILPDCSSIYHRQDGITLTYCSSCYHRRDGIMHKHGVPASFYCVGSRTHLHAELTLKPSFHQEEDPPHRKEDIFLFTPSSTGCWVSGSLETSIQEGFSVWSLVSTILPLFPFLYPFTASWG